MSFLELDGTVRANIYHHQTIADTDKTEHDSEPLELLEKLETAPVSGTVPQNNEKRLFRVTVPPDRSGELEELGKEIKRIEMEIKKLKKA